MSEKNSQAHDILKKTVRSAVAPFHCGAVGAVGVLLFIHGLWVTTPVSQEPVAKPIVAVAEVIPNEELLRDPVVIYSALMLNRVGVDSKSLAHAHRVLTDSEPKLIEGKVNTKKSERFKQAVELVAVIKNDGELNLFEELAASLESPKYRELRNELTKIALDGWDDYVRQFSGSPMITEEFMMKYDDDKNLLLELSK